MRSRHELAALPARWARRVPWASCVAGLLVSGYVAMFAWGMAHTSYDIWGALLILPVLMAVSTPILGRIAAVNPEPRIFKLLMMAMALKLLCAFPRYLMAFVLYGGQADARMYDEKGRALTAALEQGTLLQNGGHYDLGMKVAGTGFVIIVTGVVYLVTGPSLLGGFLVYSWLGFWGLLLFWRGVQIAFPEAESRRYAKLLFFLPSLLFWPSSIGKDAWMMLCLGATAYGTARLLERRRGAFAWIAAGSLGTGMVRPHVTVLAGAGLVIAYVLRRRPKEVSALGPLRTILTVAVLGVGVMLMLQQVSSFFGTAGAGQVDQVLQETARRTSQGGSQLTATAGAGISDDAAPSVSLSPLGLPMAVVTVLFRPFPFEASNLQNLVQSVECFALLIVFIRSWPRLRQVPRLFVRRPYMAFTVVYTLLFCWAFSSINNMGILSRERVQVLPLVLVLLVIPRPPAVRPLPRQRAVEWLAEPGQWRDRAWPGAEPPDSRLVPLRTAVPRRPPPTPPATAAPPSPPPHRPYRPRPPHPPHPPHPPYPPHSRGID
ncbi:hypothetical protein [Peterkaempfera bronchialis]|uniref:Glycosyltransferase RgtA/B/C/D-like domain-containing protein n=1 Tax=Peterkaempfera bronchialis TaxID=2126346 RepID=A0A345SSF8_9ACTN|nr:hypothetical protein [Peterkaempfera bronchialis]AXI76663.1 hypothetical protein C7M71_003475 [Peterkaempfera bronchialis]